MKSNRSEPISQVVVILQLFAFLLANCHATTVAAEYRVLSFGHNDEGQTGLGTRGADTLIATPVSTVNLNGETVNRISAGGRHSLLSTQDGTVYSFGSNADGRTGLATMSGDTLVATAIDTRNFADKEIVQAVAGASHSLLLADDGTVYSFGWNGFGKTGLGNRRDSGTFVATSIEATNILGRTMVQVESGGQHSLLLADDGEVFAFGVAGQTGRNAVGDSLVATPIDTANIGATLIKKISAGANHSLLLDEDGTVFSFGSTQFGQTGLGTDQGHIHIATPIDVSNLAGRKVTQISAGFSHSLLLTDDGTVFSFGSNSFGRTGLGIDTGLTLIATPIVTSDLVGRKIVEVSAGDFHSLLLADDGTVFAFGNNALGRTGLGTSIGATLIATPIDASNLTGLRIVSISAGSDSSLILAVPEPVAVDLLLVGVLGAMFRKRPWWRFRRSRN